MMFFKNKLSVNYSFKNIMNDIKKYRERVNIIPEINQAEIFDKIEKKLEKRDSLLLFGRFQKLVILGITIIFVCIVFFLFKFKEDNEKLKINELRTEIVIPDSNIKILWVQKKDFDLNKLK
jgi:hypothetical protein